MILLAAGCFAACQKTDEASVRTPYRVTVDPVITRATEVNFEPGDRIGLTVQRSGSAYAENTCMTFADGLFSGNLVWYSEASEPAALVAYYPYAEAGAPTTFSVAADQTTGYEASDLMAASKSRVLPSANAINMVFKHLLSKIVINVTNESGTDITAVTLRGSVPTATVDLPNLTAVADAASAAADIRAQQVTANESYRALVVPQTVAFELVVTTASGDTLVQPLASMTLIQGGQYSADVRVLPGELKVAVSGEIENWTDEGKIGPAAGEVPFEEHLDENYFIYDGERYNTVKLANNAIWMAEPLRYLPEGFTPSTDPAADSHIWYPYKLNDADGTYSSVNAASATALTDAESIRKYGYFYDIYAALSDRKEITEENLYDFEGAQGICPKGWHIPTRAELFALCGLSNKNDLGETGNQVDNTALFYDESYGGGKMSLYDAAGWNYVKSGVRIWKISNGVESASYQLTQLYSGNNSLSEDHYGEPALTYIMSSTGYKALASNNVPYYQFFTQMTTFTKVYPEGRINVSYTPVKAGQQVRCIRNSAE